MDILYPGGRDRPLLFQGLNPFGHNRQRIDFGHLYDAVEQGALFMACADLLGQRTVNLDDVYGQVKEVVEAAVAYAKIIQGNLDDFGVGLREWKRRAQWTE